MGRPASNDSSRLGCCWLNNDLGTSLTPRHAIIGELMALVDQSDIWWSPLAATGKSSLCPSRVFVSIPADNCPMRRMRTSRRHATLVRLRVRHVIHWTKASTNARLTSRVFGSNPVAESKTREKQVIGLISAHPLLDKCGNFLSSLGAQIALGFCWLLVLFWPQICHF